MKGWEFTGTHQPLKIVEKPDPKAFPGLPLGISAGRTGGSMPTVFNAANEAAVRMFIDGRIRFVTIPEVISSCMERHKVISAPDVDDILNVESEVRRYAEDAF